LASLLPVASSIDRDRLMYLAGQSAAKSRQRGSAAAWLWPCATAASVLVAVTLTALMLGRGPQVVEKIVYVPAKEVTKPQKQPSTPVPDEKPRLAKDDVAVPSTSPKSVDKTPKRTKKPRNDYLQLRRMVMAQGVDALPKLNRKSVPAAKTPKWAPGPRTALEQSLGS